MENIKEYSGRQPQVPSSCYISKKAFILGDVILGENVSIFENVVIKGDFGKVKIGDNTNVQSGTVVHTMEDGNCSIGNGVTIGHNSIIHGCILGDFVTVGIGTTVMADASIGDYTILGAKSLIPQGKSIPSNKVAFGHPARVVRDITDREIEDIKRIVGLYMDKGKKYKEIGL